VKTNWRIDDAVAPRSSAIKSAGSEAIFFPELRSAIADIAAFMDDDEGPDFNAAQQRAIDAYSSELLPTVLGGEWSRGKTLRPSAQHRMRGRTILPARP
jgi:hypothetical protein